MNKNICIYENEFINKGYTFSFGLNHNCDFNSTDLDLCNKCLEYAKSKSEKYFNNLNQKGK